MNPARLTFGLTLVTVALAACAPSASDMDLQRSVSMYNDGLRWKRFQAAASFVPPAARAAFLDRYLASEERLQIESLEVKSVAVVPGEKIPTYDVFVAATAYMLPSNVVERIVFTERWQQLDGAWQVVHVDRELAPPRGPGRP
jgi:hypothetical protein